MRSQSAWRISPQINAQARVDPVARRRWTQRSQSNSRPLADDIRGWIPKFGSSQFELSSVLCTERQSGHIGAEKENVRSEQATKAVRWEWKGHHVSRLNPG